MNTTERIVEAVKKECPAIFKMGDFEPLIRTAIASVIGQESELLTDEMIETEAKRRFGEVNGGQYMQSRPLDIARFIKGAKWARDFLPAPPLSDLNPPKTKEDGN